MRTEARSVVESRCIKEDALLHFLSTCFLRLCFKCHNCFRDIGAALGPDSTVPDFLSLRKRYEPNDCFGGQAKT